MSWHTTINLPDQSSDCSSTEVDEENREPRDCNRRRAPIQHNYHSWMSYIALFLVVIMAIGTYDFIDIRNTSTYIKSHITTLSTPVVIDKVVVPHYIRSVDDFEPWLSAFVTKDMPIIRYKNLPSKDEIDNLIFHKEYFIPEHLNHLLHKTNHLWNDYVDIHIDNNLPRQINKINKFDSNYDVKYKIISVTYDLDYIIQKIYNGIGKDIELAMEKEHDSKKEMRKNNTNFDKVYFC